MHKKIIIALFTIIIIPAIFYGIYYFNEAKQVSFGVPTENKTVIMQPEPSRQLSTKEKSLLGTWAPKDNKDNNSETYSVVGGKHIYQSYQAGRLLSEGTWSLQDDGMLSISFNTESAPSGYTLRVEFNQLNTELTFYDEGTESVFVKVKN